MNGPSLCVVSLESVDAVRSLDQVWCVVLDAFLDRGFSVRWVSLPAAAAGCPQKRKRWFCLARRGESAHVPFADSLPLHFRMGLVSPPAVPECIAPRSTAELTSTLAVLALPVGWCPRRIIVLCGTACAC